MRGCTTPSARMGLHRPRLAALLLLLLAEPLSGAEQSCTESDEDARDLSGDGGVTKRVLQAGAGEPPAAGSWLHVRYVGSLDGGAVFDRSKDDAPLGFTLGSGAVIRGWDIAFATMAVGERANLTVCARRTFPPPLIFSYKTDRTSCRAGAA